MANGRIKQIAGKIMLGAFAAAIGFSVLSNLPWAVKAVNADFIVEIDDTNFPDDNFRTIVQGYDKDKDGFLAQKEVSGVKRLDVSNYFSKPDKVISDLTGIEYFPSLVYLECHNNQLTSLDVSKNTSLQSLACYNNKLTSLNVSNCTALTKLSCQGNQLTSLDIGDCTALTELSCSKNKLTSLNVSNNTALTIIMCDSNQLTSLDVGNCKDLFELSFNGNQLNDIDVSKNSELQYLWCENNQ